MSRLQGLLFEGIRYFNFEHHTILVGITVLRHGFCNAFHISHNALAINNSYDNTLKAFTLLQLDSNNQKHIFNSLHAG